MSGSPLILVLVGLSFLISLGSMFLKSSRPGSIIFFAGNVILFWGAIRLDIFHDRKTFDFLFMPGLTLIFTGGVFSLTRGVSNLIARHKRSQTRSA